MSPKRSKSFGPVRIPAKEAEPTIDDGSRRTRLLILVGLAWLIGFCLFFYSFELPNNREDLINSRPAIWIRLPDLLSLSSLVSAPWGNLARRVDLFGIAAVILAGAWGLGHLALRLVCPSIERGSAERTFFAFGLGLTVTSLLTLVLGLVGLLYRDIFLGLFVLAIAAELFCRMRERQLPAAPLKLAGSSRMSAALPRQKFWIALAIVAPFLFVMWLGSMSPDNDFDVREYHFEGPKEYFQNGRITFLPHNVYTSFPFLNEMLVLLGMVLHSDWYWGALAGKCVLFFYAPLTALGLYAAGRRWFSPTAGLLAAIVYLTSPWIDRITTIAYVESGLAFFLYAALFAAMIAIERMRVGRPDLRTILLTGLLAGSGMACKYTGVLQVVAPIGAALVIAPWFVFPNGMPRLRSALTTGLVFSVGVAITIGPWLLKNVAETGNPIYPLGYSMFGGTDLNPELDAKFRAGHTAHTPRTLAQGFVDVIADNDWSSPLWYGLAPLAFFIGAGRRIVWGLWLFVGYLFLTWWAFTHQIDRFWVPMVPVVSLLAGIGATWRAEPLWRYGRNVILALAIVFNFAFEAGSETSHLCGFNAFLMDPGRAREIAAHRYFAYLNRALPKNAKVLCVGEAEVFEAQFPLVYNTVFDKSIFQEWFAVPESGTPDDKLRLKPAAEILAKLHADGITHVYVNWQEIRRYRSPGSYGYTPFVAPSRFERLVADGVLAAPTTFGTECADGLDKTAVAQLLEAIRRGHSVRCQDGTTVIVTAAFDKLTDQERAILNEIGPSLLKQTDGRDVVINAQVFAVR